jgi:pimeloyl-ACP methyl ester carboxylesterase
VAHVVALDYPGFGRSEGELDVETASVPALAALTSRIVDAFGWSRYTVVGHDIGGGMAQHLAVHDQRVERLGLVNGVVLDSWPVPAVARFADPEVRAATSAEDLVASRREAMGKAVARPLSQDEVEDYVSPRHSPARARSWMAMAAAADPQFTSDLVDGLIGRDLPTALIWGEDDQFQKIEFAERFVSRVPRASLERVAGRHIPQEDSPDRVAELLINFLQGSS